MTNESLSRFDLTCLRFAEILDRRQREAGESPAVKVTSDIEAADIVRNATEIQLTGPVTLKP